jgi:putative acetyltransferase
VPAIPHVVPDGTKLIEAESAGDLAHIRALFAEYGASLHFSLCFQRFEEELAGLPGAYARPEGCLLLALRGDEAAGCAALRKIASGVAEMKRLFVRPAFRGKGLGRVLAEAILDEAAKAGYRSIKLDTIDSMKEAIALYRDLGFKPTSPYTHNPIPGALFMERSLPRRPGEKDRRRH